MSDIPGLIDQIESGAGGKACVVVIPNHTSLKERTYFPLYDHKSDKSVEATKEIKMFKDIGSRYIECYIGCYEIDPSDKNYSLYYSDYEMNYYSDFIQFTEPKLYVLEAKDYNFNS